MSQEKLAEKARVHINYISLLERGQRNPSLDICMKLADALGVSPAVFFAKFEPQKPRPK